MLPVASPTKYRKSCMFADEADASQIDLHNKKAQMLKRRRLWNLVLMAGLEPARREARDFKSPVSAIPPHQRASHYRDLQKGCQACKTIRRKRAAQ